MEYRLLGGSGFSVPVLTFGTGTFGGTNEFFKAWGSTDVKEATRLVDVCLETGLTMFDSSDIYSDGAAEEILGGAIKAAREGTHFHQSDFQGRPRTERGRLLPLPSHELNREQPPPSRHRLHRSFQLHAFDAMTPIEETLSTLNDLVRAGQDPLHRLL